MREPTDAELRARVAIREVLARYARGVDRCDWDLVRGCYHPDAIDDHGVYRGDVEGFIAFFSAEVERWDSTTHHVLQSSIELQAEDVAWVETASIGHHLRSTPEGGQDLITTVRYVDRFERRDGDWRIAHRQVVMEWARTVDTGPPPGLTARFAAPRRDRTDPSYLPWEP